MTFKVDNDALKVAMMRHYEEKLAKELREMFVYSGNEDTNRIWQLYLEELKRQEQQQDQSTDAIQIIVTIMGVGMIIYGIYRLIAFAPT